MNKQTIHGLAFILLILSTLFLSGAGSFHGPPETPSVTPSGTPTPTADQPPSATPVPPEETRPAAPLPEVGVPEVFFESSGFVANLGQAGEGVAFLVHGGSEFLSFGKVGLSIEVIRPSEPLLLSMAEAGERSIQAVGTPEPYWDVLDEKLSEVTYETDTLQVRFVGANPDVELEGLERLPTVYNYYFGNDSSQWFENVPGFKGILYRDLYPSVDLTYLSSGSELKSTFTVHPGGDVSTIQLAYHGAEGMSIEPNGDLRIQTEWGEYRESAPYAYQEVDGEIREIAVDFEVSNSIVGFTASQEYDLSLPLHVDPTLSYGSYLGGDGSDYFHDMRVGPDGSIFLGGRTTSGAAQGYDALMVKLNPDGSTAYWTIEGGSGFEQVSGLAVDPSGNAYVVGRTNSDRPSQDVLVLRLNPDGGVSERAYLVGTGTERARKVDYAAATGRVYIVGETDSSDFQLMKGFQSEAGGGDDAFLVILDDSLSLVYSTRLGGSGDELGRDLEVGPDGSVYITGSTDSDPFTAAAPVRDYMGGVDGYVLRLYPETNQLMFFTYLGGSGGDHGHALGLDRYGNLYVTGSTASDPLDDEILFPTTSPCFQEGHNGGTYDAFITHMSGLGEILQSCYLGGSGVQDSGTHVLVDGQEQVWLTGFTSDDYVGEVHFPSVGDPLQPDHGGGLYDGFLVQARPDLLELDYSTHLGGNGSDLGIRLAILFEGANQVLFATGYTGSSEGFPLQDPLQNSLEGSQDGFILRFGDLLVPPPWVTSVYVDIPDPDRIIALGLRLGREGRGGLVILSFGRAFIAPNPLGNEYGVKLFQSGLGPGGFIPIEDSDPLSYPFVTVSVADMVNFFARGWWYGFHYGKGIEKNPGAVLRVAAGLNNCYEWVDSEDKCIVDGSGLTREHAIAWARMVETLQDRLIATGMVSRIVIHAGMDVELAWNTPENTLTWIQAYNDYFTGSFAPPYLLDFGACEGCSGCFDFDEDRVKPACIVTHPALNPDKTPRVVAWTMDEVLEKAFGAPLNYPVPEIYKREDFLQTTNSEEWYTLSRYSHQVDGVPILFYGVLTQCQRLDRNRYNDNPLECDHRFDGNEPDTGWLQLMEALIRDVRTRIDPIRWLTDIEYLSSLVPRPPSFD